MLLLITLVTGCGSNKTIKIAYVAGLTGDLSELGVYGRNAFLLRVNEINESGGIDGKLIEPIIYDDLNDPDTIKDIYEDIKKQDIKFVVGHILSSLAESVLEEAQNDDILILTATMSTQLIDNIDDNLIRTCISNSLQGAKMAEIITGDNHKSVLIVTDQRNTTYSNEFAETFSNQFDGTIKTIQYLPDDNSLEVVLSEVATGQYSSLLMVTPALDTALLSQKAKLINDDIQLYSVSWSMSKDLLTNGGKHVEGLKIVYQDSNQIFDSVSNEFYEAYLAEYNEESNFIGEVTYEITTLLADAISNSKEIDATTVKGNLINKVFNGLSGEVEINEFGDRPGLYSTYIIKEGEFIQID